MTEAIKDAMRQSGVRPEEIEYINAHGSGTKQNDIHETSAFKNALGEHAYNVPISSIKSMIGHSLGGIGSIEMAACALVIDRGVVPPTANWENRDPLCDLDYTPNASVHPGHLCALDGQRIRWLSVRDDLLRAAGAAGGERVTSEYVAPTVHDAARLLAADGDHRDRRRRPERGRDRGVVEGDQGGAQRARPDQAPRHKYATKVAGEVDGFDADDYIERRLQVQTDRWTHGAGGGPDGLRRRGLRPRRQRRVDAERDHRVGVGGQRVRPEGDPEPMGEGARVRRCLPIDRVVLCRDHRPDLDPPQHEGSLRGRAGRGGGGLEALQHGRRNIRRGVLTVVSGGLEAPIGLQRAHLPDR